MGFLDSATILVADVRGDKRSRVRTVSEPFKDTRRTSSYENEESTPHFVPVTPFHRPAAASENVRRE